MGVSERASESDTRLLIISNGHGEDTMGALLAKTLSEQGWPVAAFPLVGMGQAYRRAHVPVLGFQGVMPSGGFILEGNGAFIRDVRAGLLRLTWRQIQELRNIRSSHDWVLAVGDIYPLVLSSLFMRKPCIFIPTAKSDYIRAHFKWEIAIMRRNCRAVFPRDLRTTISLASHGVPVEYLGNLMMDALNFTHDDFGLAGQPAVALLPGSREPEAYANALMVMETAALLAEDTGDNCPAFLLALAGSLSQTRLAAVSREHGWQWEAPNELEADSGICGWMKRAPNAKVMLVRQRFGDVLANCQVAIGMSGTGNEQAVGMGLPVVTPPGAGPQFTAAFVSDQKRLLGEAVMVINEGPAAVAAAVHVLLNDTQQRQRMAKVGQERMGEPGAAGRMTQRITTLITKAPTQVVERGDN